MLLSVLDESLIAEGSSGATPGARAAALMLRQDLGRQSGGQRDQRGVPTFGASVDPAALEPHAQALGGEVAAGVPAGDQPSLRTRSFELPVAQRARDRVQRLRRVTSKPGV